MMYNKNTNSDSPDSGDDPNSFMVNPIPPENGSKSLFEMEPAKIDATKSFVGTGMTELELKEDLPELKGDIILVNGYHSNPVENSEQTFNNAARDVNPDYPHDEDYHQGESANEHNRADQADIFTNEELEEQLPEDRRTPRDIKVARNMGWWLTPLSFNNDVSKFWSYWNKKANKFDAADTYGRYFNAYRSDHYINGSHGLASNGAHRIDHGIALGYRWAKTQWDIKPEEEVTGSKEHSPHEEGYSPPYRPVTIVAHSHGAAVGAGAALGIMRYAGEQGWDQMALNMIFLGVHQPQGLTGDEYKQFIHDKVNYYEVNQDFPDIFGEDESQGPGFLNRLAELFSGKYDKIKQERGIVEHLQEITGDWEAFAGRAVQFTFANDRADMVTRDGDIPGITSAANPDGDSKLFCTEYIQPPFKPKSYMGAEGKKPMATDIAGTLILSEYIANRRFEYGDLDWFPSDKEKKFGKEMGEFEKVAIAWGNAFEAYKVEKERFKTMTGKDYEYKYAGVIKNLPHRYFEWVTDQNPATRTAKNFIRAVTRNEAEKQYAATTRAYETMLERYAWLQEAMLYAHFCPVSHIRHPQLLADFPSDSLGKESIWARIKKAGENMFYRVEYDSNPKKVSQMGDTQKRRKEKEYVEGKGKNNLVNVSFADTQYIRNVIEVFFHKKGDDENIERLYHEPGEGQK